MKEKNNLTFLTTEEAAKLLKVSTQKLYAKKGIPYHQPEGKNTQRWYIREELIDWLMNGDSDE